MNGAVEKVLVKGFKFLILGIYLIYLTSNLLTLSLLNTFSTAPNVCDTLFFLPEIY